MMEARKRPSDPDPQKRPLCPGAQLALARKETRHLPCCAFLSYSILLFSCYITAPCGPIINYERNIPRNLPRYLPLALLCRPGTESTRGQGQLLSKSPRKAVLLRRYYR